MLNKIWIAMAALFALQVMLANCGVIPEDKSDKEALDRHSRGLVLRSWRNAHQVDDQQSNSKVLDSTKGNNMLTHGALHRDLIGGSTSSGNFLSNLPVSMKLMLLQRLTGHDKRTPNSKAFMGMRGKKADVSYWTSQEDADVDDWSAASAEESNQLPDQQSVGRISKKMMPVGSSAQERQLIQQYMEQMAGMKRAPSSNSFMGMRGKRSGEESSEWAETESSSSGN